MKNNLSKNFIVKIPKKVFVFYTKNNCIILLGPLGTNSIQLNNRVIVSNHKKLIFVTDSPFFKIFSIKTHTFKYLQKTYGSLLKKKINEVLKKKTQRLNLVGVGYRAVIIKTPILYILHFKLGFSHSVYFRIPNNLTIACSKPNKIFISGICQRNVNEMASFIKSYKFPDCYKGKGILYNNEKITLKEGKRV